MLILLLTLLFGQGDAANAMEARFNREAKSAWEDYPRFARTLQGSTSAETRDPVTRKLVRKLDREFKQSGGHSLTIDQFWSEPEPDDTPVSLAAKGRKVANVVNSRYAFSLEKRVGASDWVVIALENQGDVVSSKFEARRKVGVHGSASHHFFVDNDPVEVLFAHPDWTILSIKPQIQESSSRELCRVDFRFDPSNRKEELKRAVRGGWILFDPDAKWCVAEYELVLHFPSGKLKAHRKNNYELFGAYPVLRSQSETQDGLQEKPQSSNQKKFKREILTTCAFGVSDQLPEADFTLSAFGLPEPRSVRERGSYPLWILSGIVLLMTAFGSMLWLRRKRTRVAVA